MFDNLEINGKIYYDVVKQIRDNRQLFYNKTYGILQVIDGDKAILSIKSLSGAMIDSAFEIIGKIRKEINFLCGFYYFV